MKIVERKTTSFFNFSIISLMLQNEKQLILSLNCVRLLEGLEI